MAQERKIGVFVCYCGGNISDYVDVEQVRAGSCQRNPGLSLPGPTCLPALMRRNRK